jgi:hypothetical protein
LTDLKEELQQKVAETESNVENLQTKIEDLEEEQA